METLLKDIRYGVRSLLKHPGFTAIVVITLALGIGANTAIFSLIDTVLLKSLPVQDPEQLVAVTSFMGGQSGPGFSYPVYQDLRDRNQVFSGIFAYDGVILNLSGSGETDRVSGELVSGNFFSVLGVKPFLGRVFSEDDDRIPGGHPVAILSYGFWQSRFDGDQSLIGKTIHLNGYPFTVIGISGPGFFGVEVGSSPDVWVPMMMQTQVSAGLARLNLRNNFWVNIMARLKPDIGEQQAQAATNALYHQINLEAPGISSGLRNFLLQQQLQLQPASKGLSGLRKNLKQPLLILMGVVGFVLLIACANVANLFLARAAARQKEIAVRLALGASRNRLVRQLLIESTLLSLAGGLLGLLFAFWTIDVLASSMTKVITALELHPDVRVFSFTFCVAVVSGILFGLVPALQSTRPNLISALKNEVPSIGSYIGRFELRKVLVISQLALSLLLLVGAGLFIRTLHNLNGVDLGFGADRVLLLSTNPGLNGYTASQVRNFYAQLLDRVRGLPDVESASFADMPLLGGAWIDGLAVEGYQPRAGQDMSTTAKKVEPKFFETMGIPLLTGRDFDAHDGPNTTKVAIVNERIARDFFGGGNPIGKLIGVGSQQPDCEIVGVIKDTKYRDIREQVPRTVYVPFAQATSLSTERTLHVRTVGAPKNLVAAIRNEAQAVDKNLPVYNVRTFSELVAESLSQERLIATLSSSFGILALLLASIGLYGVMAYSVARRTHEIGIRMALGARASDVRSLVVRQALALVLVGASIGVVAALALTRVMSGLLFNVSAKDPATIITAVLALTAVALLACYIPARRAMKVDPLVALRYE